MPFSGSMDEQIEVHPDNRILLRAEKKWVLCDNLERWDGVGGRLERQGHIYTYAWFMMIYYRNLHNTVNQSSSK